MGETATSLSFDNLTKLSLSKLCRIFRSFRSSHSDVFLRKGFLKICNKFTGEHTCWSVTSIKLLCNQTSTWVFSCKFAAYFQNTFFSEDLWMTASSFSFFHPNIVWNVNKFNWNDFLLIFCMHGTSVSFGEISKILR